jgi:predicted XRE-type DNA-binding protein
MGHNVYADLGFENPEDMLIKAELVSRLGRIIEERGLTQEQAAALMGLDQPKVSALLRGRFQGYSLDRIFRLLVALDEDVSIVVEPKSNERGRVSVVAR